MLGAALVAVIGLVIDSVADGQAQVGHGVDQLGFLLAETPAIDSYEAAHPGRVVTTTVRL